MPVRQALKRCPDLVLLPPNPRLYARASRALHEILRRLRAGHRAPRLRPRLSRPHRHRAALRPGGGRGRADAARGARAAPARRLGRRRRQQAGEPGGGTHRASSPSRCSRCRAAARRGFLAPHPLDVLPDLHPRACAAGSTTISSISSARSRPSPRARSCAVFGGAGRTLRAQARGIDPRPVLPPEQQAEFHVAHTLATDTNDLGVLHPCSASSPSGSAAAPPARAGGAAAPRRAHLRRPHRRRARRAAPRAGARRRAAGTRRAARSRRPTRGGSRCGGWRSRWTGWRRPKRRLDLWEKVGGISSHFEHGERGLSEESPLRIDRRRPGAPASREPGPRLAGRDRSYPRSLGRARRSARHRPRARWRVAESRCADVGHSAVADSTDPSLTPRPLDAAAPPRSARMLLPCQRGDAVSGSAEIVERSVSESDSLPTLFSMAASRARSRLERFRSRLSASFASLSAPVARRIVAVSGGVAARAVASAT